MTGIPCNGEGTKQKFYAHATGRLQATILMSHAHFTPIRRPSRPATAGKKNDKRWAGMPGDSRKLKGGISGGIETNPI